MMISCNFRCKLFINSEALDAFLRAGEFTNEAIHEFSEMAGVGPGIVVGGRPGICRIRVRSRGEGGQYANRNGPAPMLQSTP